MSVAALAPQDAARVAEISEELLTLRLDGGDPFDAAMGEVRRLLEVDTVGMYGLREGTGRLEIARWHMDGIPRRAGTALEEVLAEAPDDVVFYDSQRPDARERNRIVEATSMIDRLGPGTWERSRLCQKVLRPVGLGRHQQHRVLLCDGPSLLAWFGTIHPTKLDRRQHRVMTALISPIRRRLMIDRQLQVDPRRSAAFGAALEQIGAAAFLIGAGSEVHEANAAGRALIAMRRADVIESLRGALAGRRGPLRVELTEVREPRVAPHWLAIVRQDPMVERIAACARTWGLTARQTEVLVLVSRGLANATIGAELGIRVRTVEMHVTALFDRVGVDSRAALIARVFTS